MYSLLKGIKEMGEDLGLLKAATTKMRWHEERQNVLAQNMANSDTPGYQARDIKPLNFKELLKTSSSGAALSAATTSSAHITPNDGSSSTNFKIEEDKTTFETTPTGNSVSTEEQLFKMNENFVDHRLTTIIYQKNIDALNKATRSQ